MLLCKVEWWLTTSRRKGVLLKQTNFTAFTNETTFNYITRLNESDLIAYDAICVCCHICLEIYDLTFLFPTLLTY